MTTRTLYHFTSRWMLPRIMRMGLTRGDVPVSPARGYSSPWLTADPSWEKQQWARGSALDKCEVRITVKVDESRLKTWEQICKDHDIPAFWSEALGRAGGHSALSKAVAQASEWDNYSYWYVHSGKIMPSAFVKVELRGGLRPLDAMDLPPHMSHLKQDGTERKPSKAVWQTITRAAFLRETDNWVRSPDMQYPWSDMPLHLLRLLSRCDPNVAAKGGLAHLKSRGIDPAGGIPDDPRYSRLDLTVPAALTLSGVSRWLNSQRAIIDLSTPAMELLHAWEPRFHGLPLVLGRPWKKGVMFRFQDDSLALMMYMEPLEGDDPGVRHVLWAQDQYKRWGTVLPKHLSAPGSGSGDEPLGTLDTYTQLDHTLKVKNRLALMECGTRIDLGKLRRVAINAMAAMHEDPSIVLGSRKAPRKNRRRKAGPVGRVKRLTLSYDGARMVMRRWVILPTPEQTEKIEHKSHASPVEHDVDPHYWHVWVNTLKAGEKILDNRQKTRVRNGKTETYMQFRVRRWRGAADGTPFKRGKGIKPKVARIVTGPDDLSPPGNG